MSGQGKRGGLCMFMPYSQIYNITFSLIMHTNKYRILNSHVRWIEEWAYVWQRLVTAVRI